MMDPFVSEIRIFANNFAPRGWAFCNGQILPISQNTALFALIGTTYGGNGTNTFALPNFQSSVPVSNGQGPGLSNYSMGTIVGTESVTLQSNQIPPHSHQLMATSTTATGTTAAGQQLANAVKGSFQASFQARFYSSGTADAQLNAQSLAPVGAGGPHNNMMPYLTLNFCIALQGVFPPRP